jgi:hypothetical protein
MKAILIMLGACAGMLFACVQTADKKVASAAASSFDESFEKAAILRTIERETSCFFKRDYECWKETYAQTEHAFQAWNNSDGTYDAKVGWQEVRSGAEKYMSENPEPELTVDASSVRRHNLKVRFFNENLAYLTWDQSNWREAEKKYYRSKEARIMEKIDGQWRILHVTAFWDYQHATEEDPIR